MILNPDGTGIIHTVLKGEASERNCTWTFDNNKLTLWSEGFSPDEMTLNHGQLTEELDIGMLVFGREEADTPLHGEAVPLASAEDLQGAWTLTQCRIDQMTVPFSFAGYSITLVIQGQKAMMTMISQEETSA